MPAWARARVSGTRRADSEPWIERRNGRIRAEGEDCSGIEQRAERECAPGASRPVAIGDISVIEGVLGLDARDNTQLRETAQVGVVQQLRMLDAAARARARKRMQRH